MQMKSTELYRGRIEMDGSISKPSLSSKIFRPRLEHHLNIIYEENYKRASDRTKNVGMLLLRTVVLIL